MKFFKIVILVICMIIFGNLPHGNAQFFILENPLVGQKAPNFKSGTLSGNEISFYESKGNNKAIVFFWATWCPHCEKEIKKLSSMIEQLQNNDIRLFVIDVGETEQEILQATRNLNLDIDFILDKDGEISENYSLLGVPSYFFVDSKGKIITVKHSFPENFKEIFSSK